MYILHTCILFLHEIEKKYCGHKVKVILGFFVDLSIFEPSEQINCVLQKFCCVYSVCMYASKLLNSHQLMHFARESI